MRINKIAPEDMTPRQLGPVSREFIDPYPAGQVPGYVMKKITAGVRLVLGF